MGKLILVRHAECTGEGVVTKRGIEHVHILADTLREILAGKKCHVVTSRTPRTNTTGMLLKAVLFGGASEMLECDELPTLDFGDTQQEIDRQSLLADIDVHSCGCDALICVTHWEVVMNILPYYRAYRCLCADAWSCPQMVAADAFLVDESGHVVYISPYRKIGLIERP